MPHKHLLNAYSGDREQGGVMLTNCSTCILESSITRGGSHLKSLLDQTPTAFDNVSSNRRDGLGLTFASQRSARKPKSSDLWENGFKIGAEICQEAFVQQLANQCSPLIRW